MRRICLSLALVVLVASTVQAQGRRQGGRGGFQMGPLTLLTNESVAKELKLSDEQKKKAEEAAKANNDERRKLMQDAGITFQNIREKRDEMEKINKTLSEKADKAMEGIALTTEQNKRFGQIRLQLQGIRAFTNEKVQKDLNVTDDQKKKIKETTEALAKEREEIFKDINFRDREKFQEAQKKFAEKQKEAEGQIAASLSAEQKKTWKDMTGEKFEIKFEQRRPGGGGGQPRRPRTDLD